MAETPGFRDLSSGDKLKYVFHTVMQDGSIAALFREAIKDIRQTLHESYFGKGEHAPEIAAPLNPLYSDLQAARQGHQAAREALIPPPSLVITNPHAHLTPEQIGGLSHGNHHGHGM